LSKNVWRHDKEERGGGVMRFTALIVLKMISIHSTSYCVYQSSRKVPECNSSWLDNAVRVYNYVDVSVAVAVEDGTVAPVIRDAHSKGLADISSSVKSLVVRYLSFIFYFAYF
jgi:pyruvate/2-oxoglutarate dehydrogenase complex dihydrolipoamide acyltransferase (E2) component